MNAEVLHSFLSKCNYDESETEYLVNGILNGFSVTCEKKTFQDNCKNLKSALEFPHVVSDKICKELKDNKIAGPFFHKPLSKLHVSPIGICKKKERNKYRMIFHLSHPKGDSVNDFIAEEFSTVQYTRVSDAVSGIKSFESKCYMAKTDISNAYRNLPLKPEEYHLFGFKWNNLYYYDRCLPMGCSSLCQIFERFSTGLHGIGQHYMPEGLILHILDDFLILAPTYSCKQYLDTFLHICNEIGLPMAADKTFGPTTCLTFLGIELDTVSEVARLPDEKI